jgi:phosphoribosylformimino-5-aminoimidazole carboxamide ribotide isomerase
MGALRVIPVLDLMHGVVVRGVAGRRSEYRPIESRLCSSAGPVVVARAIVEKLGLSEFYIADLDAIAGAEPAWGLYEQLIGLGATLIVDAGAGDEGRAKALADFCTREASLSGVIVGLESLKPVDGEQRGRDNDESDRAVPPHHALSPCGGEGLIAALRPLVDVIGANRIVLSLDLKAGQPLTDVAMWRAMAPLAIAESAIASGVSRLIVLDLANVGVDEGVGTLALCQELRARHPQIEIIAGGGVRGPDDLAQMASAGCNAALVASALHDGRLTRKGLVAE